MKSSGSTTKPHVRTLVHEKACEGRMVTVRRKRITFPMTLNELLNAASELTGLTPQTVRIFMNEGGDGSKVLRQGLLVDFGTGDDGVHHATYVCLKQRDLRLVLLDILALGGDLSGLLWRQVNWLSESDDDDGGGELSVPTAAQALAAFERLQPGAVGRH